MPFDALFSPDLAPPLPSFRGPAACLIDQFDFHHPPGVRVTWNQDLLPDDALTIRYLRAFRQGHGDGSRALRRITVLADRLGVTLWLLPLDDGRRGDLVRLYRRFGFEFDGPGHPEAMMVRRPRVA